MWRAAKEPDGSSSASDGSARSVTGWRLPAGGAGTRRCAPAAHPGSECAEAGFAALEPGLSALGTGEGASSDGGAGAAALGELVVGGVHGAAVDPLRGQLGQLAGQL